MSNNMTLTLETIAETAQFQPEEIKRNKNGYWLHSVLENNSDELLIDEFPEARGMEFHFVMFDADAPEHLQKEYSEELSPNISDWNPTPPKGDGWFLIGIYDTDDSPCACFVRPQLNLD